MDTREILSRGTKPENPVRDINIKPRPPWAEQMNLQWFKDEIANLERDKRELEEKLYDKETEIEELLDEIEELHNKIIADK